MNITSNFGLQIATVAASVLLAGWLGFRMERLLEKEPGTREDLAAKRSFCWNMVGRSLMDASYFMLGFTVFRFHAEYLGAPVWFTPLYLGIIVFTQGIGSLLWGAIADRYGRRKLLLIIGCSLTCILMAPMPFVGLIPFLILSILQVLCIGSTRIPFALASEWIPKHSGEAIGLMHATGWMLAVGLGAVAGGVYSDHGLIPVAIIAILFYATAVICFLKMTGDIVEQKKVSSQLKVKNIFAFNSRWPVLIIGVILLISIPRGAIVLNSINYIEKIGFDLEFLFILEAWALALNVILFTYAGVICDKFGSEKVLTASALIYFVLWALFAIGMPTYISVAIYLIPVVGLLYTSSDTILARHTTIEERNRGIGMAAAAVFIGQSIGSAITSGIMAVLDSSQGGFFGMIPANAEEQYLWSFRLFVPILAIATICGWKLTQMMAAESEIQDAIIESD
ncbi:MAG: MFS transporter [Candidatus Thalassarchaeaceae archaeon]|jgi:MFS family permease|nr:MFS transporter [Candidatus Thalassarchaeaceae archaeon]